MTCFCNFELNENFREHDNVLYTAYFVHASSLKLMYVVIKSKTRFFFSAAVTLHQQVNF